MTTVKETVCTVLINVVLTSKQEVSKHIKEKPATISTGTQTVMNTGGDSVWRSIYKVYAGQTGGGLKITLKRVKNKPMKAISARKLKKCAGKCNK